MRSWFGDAPGLIFFLPRCPVLRRARRQASLQDQFHGSIDRQANDPVLPVDPAVGLEQILLRLKIALHVAARIGLNARRWWKRPRARKRCGDEGSCILGFLEMIEEPDKR